MAKIVYKYDLEDVTEQEIELPEGHVITKIAFQGEEFGARALKLWALVDTEAERVSVSLRIFATRCRLDRENLEFLATAISSDGRYVLHVFQETP